MRRLLAAGLASLGLAACNEPPLSYQEVLGAPAPATSFRSLQRLAPRDRHELGRQVYNFRCYYCHGYSGDARTLAASFIDPPPRNFAATAPGALSREAMLDAVRAGRPGTAMASFRGIISEPEIAAVVDFVREEFMLRRAVNTRYHTAENGWPGHERHRIAFPFATGDIPLDTPWESLTPDQVDGKRLFLASCITCHDRSRVTDDRIVWEGRPLSYPRNNYVPGAAVDATTSASPYALHDIPPKIAQMSADERRGEALYQGNCAFCHGGDGTGKNWIGSFMEPHPRNLTDPAFMASLTRGRLRQVIREGLPNTSMPAWKSVLKPDEIDAVVAYISRAFHPVAEDAAR